MNLGAPMAVHQFVPTFEPGAVGGHIVEVQRVLQAAGIASEVFTEHLHPAFEGRARRYEEYGRAVRAARDDVLVYHLAIGSVVADFVAGRPERLVVDHHNITPPEYFDRWEPDVVHGIRWGRHQLATLAERAALGIADSAFNVAELTEAGYPRTAVVPILVADDALVHDVDAAALESLLAAKADGGADLLFVGRIAPNKAQHDLVKVLAAYRRLYDADARLHLVGASSADAYASAITRFAASTGLADAVHLTGPVTPGVLAAHYRTADVFVCVSEHEGFCVPLLEAWDHDVPIVAYASTAVPETLGDGGVLLASKEPALVAAAVDRVCDDASLRSSLVAAGRRRRRELSLERSSEALVAALTPLVPALGTPPIAVAP